MDVLIHRCDGVPKGSKLSVLAGPTRRQAPFEIGRPMKFRAEDFPKGDVDAVTEIQIDIFQLLGRGKLELKPTTERYALQLASQVAGCQGFSCELEIQRPERHRRALPAEQRPPAKCQPVKRKQGGKTVPHVTKSGEGKSTGARRHEAALHAQQYMEHHHLLQAIQKAMLVTVKDKPEDPLNHMAKQLMQASADSRGTGFGGDAPDGEPTRAFEGPSVPLSLEAAPLVKPFADLAKASVDGSLATKAVEQEAHQLRLGDINRRLPLQEAVTSVSLQRPQVAATSSSSSCKPVVEKSSTHDEPNHTSRTRVLIEQHINVPRQVQHVTLIESPADLVKACADGNLASKQFEQEMPQQEPATSACLQQTLSAARTLKGSCNLMAELNSSKANDESRVRDLIEQQRDVECQPPQQLQLITQPTELVKASVDGSLASKPAEQEARPSNFGDLCSSSQPQEQPVPAVSLQQPRQAATFSSASSNLEVANCDSRARIFIEQPLVVESHRSQHVHPVTHSGDLAKARASASLVTTLSGLEAQPSNSGEIDRNFLPQQEPLAPANGRPPRPIVRPLSSSCNPVAENSKIDEASSESRAHMLVDQELEVERPFPQQPPKINSSANLAKSSTEGCSATKPQEQIAELFKSPESVWNSSTQQHFAASGTLHRHQGAANSLSSSYIALAENGSITGESNKESRAYKPAEPEMDVMCHPPHLPSLGNSCAHPTQEALEIESVQQEAAQKRPRALPMTTSADSLALRHPENEVLPVSQLAVIAKEKAVYGTVAHPPGQGPLSPALLGIPTEKSADCSVSTDMPEYVSSPCPGVETMPPTTASGAPSTAVELRDTGFGLADRMEGNSHFEDGADDLRFALRYLIEAACKHGELVETPSFKVTAANAMRTSGTDGAAEDKFFGSEPTQLEDHLRQKARQSINEARDRSPESERVHMQVSAASAFAHAEASTSVANDDESVPSREAGPAKELQRQADAITNAARFVLPCRAAEEAFPRFTGNPLEEQIGHESEQPCREATMFSTETEHSQMQSGVTANVAPATGPIGTMQDVLARPDVLVDQFEQEAYQPSRGVCPRKESELQKRDKNQDRCIVVPSRDCRSNPTANQPEDQCRHEAGHLSREIMLRSPEADHSKMHESVTAGITHTEIPTEAAYLDCPNSQLKQRGERFEKGASNSNNGAMQQRLEASEPRMQLGSTASADCAAMLLAMAEAADEDMFIPPWCPEIASPSVSPTLAHLQEGSPPLAPVGPPPLPAPSVISEGVSSITVDQQPWDDDFRNFQQSFHSVARQTMDKILRDGSKV